MADRLETRSAHSLSLINFVMSPTQEPAVKSEHMKQIRLQWITELTRCDEATSERLSTLGCYCESARRQIKCTSGMFGKDDG